MASITTTCACVRPQAAWQASRRHRPMNVAVAAVPTPFNSADAADDESSPAAQYSTRLEHMDTLVLHREPSTRRWEDLDQAERELTAFCTMLGPEDETEKCWQAYSYLEQRREDAVASCDWEHPESCSELEHLNEMARQLISTGSMDDLVATFSSLARVAELRRGQAAGPQEAQAHEAPPPDPGAVAEADAVHSLFQRMDLNGDGRLSVSELHQGMALLGDELDELTVGVIADAMDLEGFLTERQFRDIVEAEQINSKSEWAHMLRHQQALKQAWRSLS